jgi:hypothetical protein
MRSYHTECAHANCAETKCAETGARQVMQSAIEGSLQVYKLLQAVVLEECASLAAAKGRIST